MPNSPRQTFSLKGRDVMLDMEIAEEAAIAIPRTQEEFHDFIHEPYLSSTQNSPSMFGSPIQFSTVTVSVQAQETKYQAPVSYSSNSNDVMSAITIDKVTFNDLSGNQLAMGNGTGKIAQMRTMRIVQVPNKTTKYVHGADLGQVIERGSNISRLFQDYESPREKLLCKVASDQNPTSGQKSNVISAEGVRRRFLPLDKVTKYSAFLNWINFTLLPRLS